MTVPRPPWRPDDLIAMAIAYLADELAAPPEALAATPATSARSCGTWPLPAVDAERMRDLDEAVDAVDDELAADVVVDRLSRCLTSEEEP